MIASLSLHPLPSLRADDAPGSLEIERNGFVDDAVVLAMVAVPVASRISARPVDLALSSSEDDFAGWQVSPPAPPPVSEPVVRAGNVPAPAKRATPPTMKSQATIISHRGTAGWWLAGLSGIFTSLLVAAVLLTWDNPPREIPAGELEAGRIVSSSPSLEIQALTALPTALTEAASQAR